MIIKTSNDFKVTAWSGGTTTELMVYPESASFQDRNFEIRLSIATVQVEESIFTSLPNVDRTLLILDGEIELNHEGHHRKVLRKFDFDTFKGDWTTHSKGICVDFNLMTTGDRKGKVKGMIIEKGSTMNLFNGDIGINCIYILKGEAEVSTNEESKKVNAGDLVQIIESIQGVCINAKTTTEIVVVSVKR